MTIQFPQPVSHSFVTSADIGLPQRDEWTPLYSDIDLSLDREEGIYWCHLQPQSRPSVTPELLRDVTAMQSFLRAKTADAQEEGQEIPFKYFVVASRSEGIFNLGGDLRLFADAVRKKQKLLLRTYAHACVDIVWNNLTSYNQPVVTVALVQGDALGGGFETALSCNVIVAERSAKFGLPEVLFNLFPGMGAYSLIARRIGALEAERMIMSGKIYTAEELHRIGLVDVLAEDGQGEAALRSYVSRHKRMQNAMQAVFQTRNQVAGITLQELRNVTDIWVDAAMRLTATDLRKMERLAAAQDRRCNINQQETDEALMAAE
ncbi:crotonase/enoyl-CoA hydratase family protein [Aureimonas fodinaquatilis]|uniref:Crotonase/enoyl-CoA hydratase family protein n=1 Tax=Aureimonas fodinaquatilis TaxID=2565783 RepID=A0A5B0DXB7_9HYPH|nr:crotonase/enoyl-CoA hydratase family protein [Aureimonas fodinaquatilis]KAA0970515.1 crotonase/enoyl-CoA hydratase family protein [Aureimonas fodinaquatilis]